MYNEGCIEALVTKPQGLSSILQIYTVVETTYLNMDSCIHTSKCLKTTKKNTEREYLIITYLVTTYNFNQ